MAEQDRAGEADRFAHGTGRTETHEAERDSFRPGETGPGVAGAGPQSIEATTAALGDMEPSAGSGGAGSAEADDDTDA
jgi:hypothetical protein